MRGWPTTVRASGSAGCRCLSSFRMPAMFAYQWPSKAETRTWNWKSEATEWAACCETQETWEWIII
jgi:hypothetical protein